jgi:hypothetical protein
LEITLFSFSRRCFVVSLTGCGFVLVTTNHLSGKQSIVWVSLFSQCNNEFHVALVVRFDSGLGHHHG